MHLKFTVLRSILNKLIKRVKDNCKWSFLCEHVYILMQLHFWDPCIRWTQKLISMIHFVEATMH